MKILKKTFVIIFILFCSTNNLNCMKQNQEWTEKTKWQETITFRWCDIFNKTIFQKMCEVFADAFSPLYPEGGYYTYLAQYKPPKSELDDRNFFSTHKKQLAKCGRNYFIKKLTKEWEELKLLQSQNKLSTLCAFKNDELIGFIIFCDIMSFAAPRHNYNIKLPSGEKYLRLIAISPKGQKRGIATKLIFGILRKFPEIKKIRLDTDIDKNSMFFQGQRNKNACVLYTHLGFGGYDEKRIGYNPDEQQFFCWINSGNLVYRPLEEGEKHE